MKVHIEFNTIEGPTGGGNQFIKSLKEELIKRDMYSESKEADIILFNSHHNVREVIKCKKSYPDKIYVHRIDGPMKLYNNSDDKRDDIVYDINNRIADAMIFQSKYSYESNLSMGLDIKDKPYKIIHNAASNKFTDRFDVTNEKTSIISVSFSNNWKKGFDIYQYIDKNLDFDKYDYTFIGNSPIKFENIKVEKPLTSEELCLKLNDSDIFITASINDPCSNAMLEAKACGLPCIVRNSGGHPEIITESDIIFNGADDIIENIEHMNENYLKYLNKKSSNNMVEVTDSYVKFFNELIKKR